jgi:hypothetical protein
MSTKSEHTYIAELKELMNTVTEIFFNSFINYIVLFAITIIIICFISSDNSESYVSDDIFHFMKILTDPCKKELRGGSGISSAINKLSTASDTVKNVGNTIDKYTTNVKHGVDLEKYLKETLGSLTDKYCSDDTNINELTVIHSAMYAVHSSWLASYNAIQWVNAGIMKCIGLKIDWMFIKSYHYIGIFIAFVLFTMLIKASTTFVASLIELALNTTNTKSAEYINTVVFSCFSSFLGILLLYFTVASIAYVTFLSYGLVNIKSEQSATTLQFMYLFLASMILLLYGFDVTSAVDVPDVPQSSDLSNLDGTPKTDRPTPEPKPPCNTSASTLSNLMFIFIIPFLASLYCLAQLVYRGLSGMVALMDTTDADMQHANKMNMVLGYLVFFIILYTLWPVFLYITIPTIIKSFATKEYLDLYYSKLKLLGL